MSAAFSQQDTTLRIEYSILSNSYYANNNKVKKRDFKQIISRSDDAFSTFKKGRFKMVGGNILSAPSVILLFITVQNWSNGNTPYAWQWAVGIGGTGLGTFLYFNGKKQTLRSVGEYNQSNTLSLGLTPHGVGLSLNF
ncbi:MAG: hypothetical protein AB8B56_17565 [Crocinitomicaceae bacterium]